MTVNIFGYKGMLGRYVYTYFLSKGYTVNGISRDGMGTAYAPNRRAGMDISDYDEHELSAALHNRGIKPGDVIINCAGTIKPMIDKHGVLNAIKVNSMFPHQLANVCEKDGYKMLHITTDCVYAGTTGQYNENSLHDCTDVYGKTKSLGEPANCTVIRTSIVGEEVDSSRSLIEWVKSVDGQRVNGFLNHQWNGITCLRVAKIFEEIVANNLYWQGVRHIFSPRSVSKYELVCILAEEYHLSVQVNPADATTPCDRTLTTIYDDVKFDIGDIRNEVAEQILYKEQLISIFTEKNV